MLFARYTRRSIDDIVRAIDELVLRKRACFVVTRRRNVPDGARSNCPDKDTIC
jgi:hypothetical protein